MRGILTADSTDSRDLVCVQKLRAARLRNSEAAGPTAAGTALPRGAVSPIANSPDSVLSGQAG